MASRCVRPQFWPAGAQPHLCEHSISLGHWSLQQVSATLSCPWESWYSPHFLSRLLMPQWHFSLTRAVQGWQGGLWQGRGQGCGQAGDRGTSHSTSHFLQLIPATPSAGAWRTLWQSLSQAWLPQARLRPHFLPQGPGLAEWQGQAEVSCWPRQVTSTGWGQGGQARHLTTVTGPRSSQGPTGRAVSSTLTVTLSWQGASQEWPQPCSRRQGALQPGQGPGWQA